MITQVKVKNWKSHRGTTIVLGDGTNVLVGMMGAGKSAVLDAITYALFGTLPAVKARKIRLEDLITSRPAQERHAEAEVKFSTDSGEYWVKRAIERERGTIFAELRKATGELVEGGSSERVTENVERILGITYDVYERAIYAEQNRLDYFLTVPKGKRMESIDELLGVKKLEEGRKNIGTLANRIGERADELNLQIQQMKADSSLLQYHSLQVEIRGLEGEISQKETELREISEELRAVVERHEALRKIGAKISDLKIERAALETRIEGLRAEKERLSAVLGSLATSPLETLLRRQEELRREYLKKYELSEKLRSECTSAQIELGALEEKKKMMIEKIKEASLKIEEKTSKKIELEAIKPEALKSALEKTKEEYLKVERSLAEKIARANTLLRSAEELSGAGAICPVCESPLSTGKKEELLEKRTREISELRKEVADLERERDSTRSMLGKLEADDRKAMSLLKEIEDLPERERELSALKEELGGVEDSIQVVREKLVRVEDVARAMKGEADLAYKALIEFGQIVEKRKALQDTEAELSRKITSEEVVRKQLEALLMEYSEEEMRKIEEKKSELSNKQVKLITEIGGTRSILETKRGLLKSIEEKMFQIRYSEVKHKHLLIAKQALDAFQTALADTQLILRKRFLESVNEVMKDLWESLYPYGDFVGIRLIVDEASGGDYSLQLRDRSGNWVNVDGGVSGGERTDACLAFRIALAMTLAPSLGWMVFDEPTHNLDERGIDELARVMKERLPEVVRQVILITHEERLEGAVSGHLYRFTRDKGKDEPTIVEHVSLSEIHGK